MYRNSYGNNYSSGSIGKETWKKSGGFAGRDSSYTGTRSPLYPIGPSLTQPGFTPVNRGFSPSPYLKHHDVKPPSYQQRYLKTEVANENRLTTQEREKKLIERNEFEIEEQQKKK